MLNSKFIPAACFLILPVCLMGCFIPFRSTEDISKQTPYSEAIGKKFVVKQDMYIYQDSDSDMNEIGTLEFLKRMTSGLPSVVDVKFIGKQAGSVKINGVVKKDQIITLNRVVMQKGFEFSYVSYRVLVDDDAYFSKHECAVDFILNDNENPPKTAHWSDPPIFKADLAEPLASDGVWWK